MIQFLHENVIIFGRKHVDGIMVFSQLNFDLYLLVDRRYLHEFENRSHAETVIH